MKSLGRGALALLMFTPRLANAVTWGEARALVVRDAPELLAAERRRQIAAAEIDVAGTVANPTFAVTTARETARLSTSVSLPLPLFGQRGAAVRTANANAQIVAAEGQIASRDLVWSATTAWVDAWEASERSRLIVGSAADAKRLLDIAAERFQSGSAPRLDVVRATADEARARADSEGAQRLVAAAGARLAVWLAKDPTAAPEVTGTPGVPAALPPLIALEASVEGHPAAARDRAQQISADAQLTLERRLRFPIVSAQLTVNQGDPTLPRDGNGNPATDIIGGASFDLPLLNQRGGFIKRAKAQRTLADAQLAIDIAHLRAEIADAYHRTEAAAARSRELAEHALPAMEDARTMTEESYRAGRVDLVRVLEAQRAVVETRLAEVDAIADWARSFADLERAGGQGMTDIEVTNARH